MLGGLQAQGLHPCSEGQGTRTCCLLTPQVKLRSCGLPFGIAESNPIVSERVFSSLSLSEPVSRVSEAAFTNGDHLFLSWEYDLGTAARGMGHQSLPCFPF